MIGSSLPQGLTTAGLPTRHASAVLLCLRGLEFARELPEEDETVEVLSAEFSLSRSSSPGLRAFMTLSARAFPLLKGSASRDCLRHNSMPCWSSFKFWMPYLLPSASVKLMLSWLGPSSFELGVSLSNESSLWAGFIARNGIR